MGHLQTARKQSQNASPDARVGRSGTPESNTESNASVPTR